VIHVCVFTTAFMLVGALKSRDRIQFALLGTYLAGLALILLLPPLAQAAPPHSLAIRLFGPVGAALENWSGGARIVPDARLMGALSFIYTYHYINWFAKARTIRWHHLAPRQWVVIALVSGGAIALYAIDYEAGFAVLLCLSAAHVILELPLDILVFRDLGRALGSVRKAPGALSAAP